MKHTSAGKIVYVISFILLWSAIVTPLYTSGLSLQGRTVIENTFEDVKTDADLTYEKKDCGCHRSPSQQPQHVQGSVDEKSTLFDQMMRQSPQRFLESLQELHGIQQDLKHHGGLWT